MTQTPPDQVRAAAEIENILRRSPLAKGGKLSWETKSDGMVSLVIFQHEVDGCLFGSTTLQTLEKQLRMILTGEATSLPAEAEPSEAHRAWHEIAYYVETHWRGAGLPEYGNWALNEIAARGHQLCDLEDKVEELTTDLARMKAALEMARSALKHFVPPWETWMEYHPGSFDHIREANKALGVLAALKAEGSDG